MQKRTSVAHKNESMEVGVVAGVRSKRDNHSKGGRRIVTSCAASSTSRSDSSGSWPRWPGVLSAEPAIRYRDGAMAFGGEWLELPAKDSATDPLAIDAIPARYTGTRFSMIATMQPGRKDRGLSAKWNRDLASDLLRAKEHGVTTVVTLEERQEFKMLGVPNYFTELEKAGFVSIWLPVVDVSVPQSFEDVHKVCYAIWQALSTGNVLVHCRGGKGRTGVICACMLVLLGYPAWEAIDIVRYFRKGAVETAAQEEWIAKFENYIASAAQWCSRE